MSIVAFSVKEDRLVNFCKNYRCYLNYELGVVCNNNKRTYKHIFRLYGQKIQNGKYLHLYAAVHLGEMEDAIEIISLVY